MKPCGFVRRIPIITLLLFCTGTCSFADPAKALFLRNTVMAPLKPLVALLGGSVAFDASTGDLIVLVRESATAPLKLRALFKVDSTRAIINGNAVTLSQPVLRHHGVVYLPAKSLSASCGLRIEWSGDTNPVAIVRMDTGKSLRLTVVKINPRDGADMVWIPAGEFTMGSLDGGEISLRKDQCDQLATLKSSLPLHQISSYVISPARTVFLDGFWMYRHEVTVEQYRRFCQSTGRTMPAASSGWMPDHPIAMVNWDDARAYAAWAGGNLPTEAQWEKAARGCDGREYPWGNTFAPTKCRNSQPVGNRPNSLPVGSYPSGGSPWGILDMAGNVAEWCLDWLGDDCEWKNPCGHTTGSIRAVRGGSWAESNQELFRTTCRQGRPPQQCAVDVGFRVTVSVAQRLVHAAVGVTRVGMLQERARLFPAGYHCTGGWQADLDSDGAPEMLLLAAAVEGGNHAQPPLLRLYKDPWKWEPVLAGEYRFDEQWNSGNMTGFHWCGVVSGAGETLPLASFGIRDVNADGIPEILVCLASNGQLSHDEGLHLLTWEKNGFRLLCRVFFPDAPKGAWRIDDFSRESPGLEIATVGRKFDEKNSEPVYEPTRYEYRYFGWNGTTYAQYTRKLSKQKYPGAQEAIAREGL